MDLLTGPTKALPAVVLVAVVLAVIVPLCFAGGVILSDRG